MELSIFKDKVFELFNESDSMDVSDIEARDAKDLLRVSMKDSSCFEITFRDVSQET